jgi:hypothetical protein
MVKEPRTNGGPGLLSCWKGRSTAEGLARGLMYAAECRLAGRSLREHEDRWFGIEHALARRDRKGRPEF